MAENKGPEKEEILFGLPRSGWANAEIVVSLAFFYSVQAQDNL